MAERRYYVYELIDPRNNEPFYVGKGHGSRIYAHVYEANLEPHNWSNRLKCQRILSIIRDNYTVIQNKISTGLTEEEAFVFEADLIQKHKLLSEGGKLTNIRKSHYHNHQTIPKRKHNGSRIVQFTTTGKQLNIFPSSIAAADSLGKHKTNILQCCHKKRHTAYGFVWRFEGDDFTPPPTEIKYHTTRRKPVCQLLDGQVIAVFNSIRDASVSTGINHSNVCSCCRGGAKSAGGFTWQYYPIKN